MVVMEGITVPMQTVLVDLVEAVELTATPVAVAAAVGTPEVLVDIMTVTMVPAVVVVLTTMEPTK
jgi:hypothetical protein